MEKLNMEKKFKFESDESVIKEMMEAYKNCPSAVKYISSLGLTSEDIEDNISKIFDLVCDLNYCKNCPGIKDCQKENPRMVTKIVLNNGFVERQLTPCKKLIAQIEFERQFIYRDFDEHLLYKSLKDIEARNVEGRKELLKRYSEYKKNNDTSWIFLNGVEGTGRSFLAAILSVDIAKRNGGPIAFINALTRIKELSSLSFKNENEFQRRMSILSGVPVLVIDDFGNEYKSDATRDLVLFPLLQKRAARRLLTIFTSDFNIDEIVEMYSPNRAAQIRAGQIGRLLKSMCKEEISLGDVSIY